MYMRKANCFLDATFVVLDIYISLKQTSFHWKIFPLECFDNEIGFFSVMKASVSCRLRGNNVNQPEDGITFPGSDSFCLKWNAKSKTKQTDIFSESRSGAKFFMFHFCTHQMCNIPASCCLIWKCSLGTPSVCEALFPAFWKKKHVTPKTLLFVPFAWQHSYHFSAKQTVV